MMSRLVRLSILISYLTLLSCPVLSRPTLAHQANSDSASLTVLQGRVLCFDGSGRELSPLFDCKEPDARFEMRAKDGKVYSFLAGDTEAAVFTDGRVRQRDLQITAKLHPGNRLELIKVQSIKDGKLYDIYYYCQICNIRAYAPGLCPCCRNELEFRETPP